MDYAAQNVRGNWLCSPEAAYITGVVIPIDGGKLAGVLAEQ